MTDAKIDTPTPTTEAAVTKEDSKPQAAPPKKEEAEAKPTEKKEGEDGKTEEYDPEEEIERNYEVLPQVDAQVVTVVTGEEEEDVFWHHRAKLYRWVDGEWKERALGDAKMLQHKRSGLIRFLIRQEKTLKIGANHYVVRKDGLCNLSPNKGSDRIWVWSAVDSSDDETTTYQFALRFGASEQATAFKEKFEEAVKINEEKFGELLEDKKEN